MRFSAASLVLGALFAAPLQPSPQVLLKGGPVRLGIGPTPVRLQLAPGAKPLSTTIASLRQGERLFLVLQDLRTDQQPGVVYQVYSGSHPVKPPSAGAAVLLGNLTFFNAPKPQGQSRPDSSRSLDVTAILREHPNALGTPITVTLIPSGQPEPSQPTIRSVELVVSR